MGCEKSNKTSHLRVSIMSFHIYLQYIYANDIAFFTVSNTIDFHTPDNIF